MLHTLLEAMACPVQVSVDPLGKSVIKDIMPGTKQCSLRADPAAGQQAFSSWGTQVRLRHLAPEESNSEMTWSRPTLDPVTF